MLLQQTQNCQMSDFSHHTPASCILFLADTTCVGRWMWFFTTTAFCKGCLWDFIPRKLEAPAARTNAERLGHANLPSDPLDTIATIWSI